VDHSTGGQLALLRKDRLDPETQVWVTYFFGHVGSSEAEREAFRDALAATGVGTPSTGFPDPIGTDEEVTGDGYWHHWLFAALPAAESDLRRVANEMQAVARRFGCTFDGWGVQRDRAGRVLTTLDKPPMAPDERGREER
jgi:hypothetical protein